MIDPSGHEVDFESYFDPPDNDEEFVPAGLPPGILDGQDVRDDECDEGSDSGDSSVPEDRTE